MAEHRPSKPKTAQPKARTAGQAPARATGQAATRAKATPRPGPSETITAPTAFPAQPAPRLYLLHPLLVGALPAWDAALERAASLGFNGVLIPPPVAPGGAGHLYQMGDPDVAHPVLDASGDSAAALKQLAEKARARGLDLYMDLVLDRVAADGRLAHDHASWFEAPAADALPDPRLPPPDRAIALARWSDAEASEALGAWWEERLRRFVEAGLVGFRCEAPAAVPAGVWRRLMAVVPQARFLAWTPGLPAEAVPGLAGLGFVGAFNSLAWWDLRDGWLAEEAQRLAPLGPTLATVEAPFGPRLAAQEADPGLARMAALRHLRLAAGMGAGLLVPMGFEFGARRPLDAARDRPGDWEWLRRNAGFDLEDELRATNATLQDQALAAGELRPLTGPGAPVAALLRAHGPDARGAEGATLTLANTDLHQAASVSAAALLPGTGGVFTRFTPCCPEEGAPLLPGGEVTLRGGETRIYRAEASAPIRGAALPAATEAPRLGIEAITPSVEEGRFAVKRIVGEVVEVTCDIICDGHDKLGAALLWRAVDEEAWREVRLTPLGNDAWTARFPLERMGRYVFVIEAWRDAFASFHDELQKKHAAGVAIGVELEEGRRLVEAAGQGAGDEVAALAARITAAGDAEKLALLLAPDTARLMAAADDRPFKLRSPEMPVEAERTGAGFASWYEVFPRSQSGSETRHGTFDDVIRQLPRIRGMGFDVLYFPPIHPIGTKNRKGRNNSLTPGPDDPGSPYAIGSEAGGHDALHPELGTLDDFLRLVHAAREHNLELALDFAIQCSPDHPWLRDHKDWFEWRPDGSIRYAENPPKKYEDIVNVDFYAKGAKPALWNALRDVVRFWCVQGVRLFRVDNPHTKPFPFWEWMIADIRAEFPDAVFLSEAFTRPKVMYRLAKVGYSQSYTYFTWRNDKAGLTEYLTELTTTAPKDFFRPHFFVNTPDINPKFLQRSGRPGFLIRAALATTLSGLWGLYQGFEYCEARAMPGKEEYLDSEKYQLRVWPDRAPGDIIDEVTRLNAIRRGNPALQSHLGLAFHHAFNDQVLWFRKQSADRTNVLLIAVSLDPHAVQQASVEVPLWEWGLPDHAALEVEDLMRGHSFTWSGKVQQITLDPHELPFGIWRVRPAGGV